MNFNETMKEIVEKYTKEIEELKASKLFIKGEKEKAEIIQDEKWNELKRNNHIELQVLNLNNKL